MVLLLENKMDLKKLTKNFIACTNKDKRVTSAGRNSSSKKAFLQRRDVGDCKIKRCKWDTNDADLYLGVNGVLFPVHRHFVALASPILRGIIVTVGHHDEFATIISIGGYTVKDIRLLLTFIYFPGIPLQEKHIERYSFLAEEFMLPTLKKKCQVLSQTSHGSSGR